MYTVDLTSHKSSGSFMRSDRILRGMHKIFSHDLPNQIVALQSLLQLFQLEEMSNLSKDGQEFVQRMHNVTQRTTEMVRFLKEMSKLNNYTGKMEEIALDMLAREIQGALKQQFSQKQFHFDWQWNVPTIIADFHTFLLGLTEIFTCLTAGSAAAHRLTAGSESSGNCIILDFQVETVAESDDNIPHLPPPRLVVATEERMEIILAAEWLAVSDAKLEWSKTPLSAKRFTIAVPNG